MNPLKRIVAAGLIGFLGVAHVARADAPDVKTLIDKTIDAAGGRDKLAAVKSISLAGTVEAPQMGLKGTVTVKTKPGHAVMVVDLGQVGEIRIGASGDVVYSQSDMEGARLITGEERDMIRNTLDPLQQSSRLEKLKDLKVVGAEDVNGVATWKVVGAGEFGKPETHWINQETSLPIRMTITVQTQMGPIDAVANLSDYKSFDGIPIPMTSEQVARGSRMVMRFTDVKINPSLPDTDFALPDEVQKLVAKQGATTRPTTNDPTGAK